jgi:hypothetical protein
MGKKPRQRQDIIRRIKEREKAEERANYTFRLPQRLIDAFKAKCEREGVSMASAIIELIEDFNRE